MTGLLVAMAIFLPIALGAAVAIAGVTRRLAPWPWPAGLGIALVPSCWMAAADLCGSLAGACAPPDVLAASRLAVVSVAAFVLAAGSLALRRSRARDAVFAGLVLFGQIWLVLRLRDAGYSEPAILIVVLIAVEVGYEPVARVRPRGDPSPAGAA